MPRGHGIRVTSLALSEPSQNIISAARRMIKLYRRQERKGARTAEEVAHLISLQNDIIAGEVTKSTVGTAPRLHKKQPCPFGCQERLCTGVKYWFDNWVDDWHASYILLRHVRAWSLLVTAADHGSQLATGPNRKEKEQEEEKEEEEEKRQAELHRAQDQLKKCLEDEDYRGAAVAKANMTALMRAAPCSQGNPPRSKADLAVAMATGLAIP